MKPLIGTMSFWIKDKKKQRFKGNYKQLLQALTLR